jgi:predicted DCC family thiol-disulfide oxidoreductase YuxK
MQRFALIEPDGKTVHRASAAVFHTAKLMDRPWPLFQVLLLIPPFIRDGVYDLVAQSR